LARVATLLKRFASIHGPHHLSKSHKRRRAGEPRRLNATPFASRSVAAALVAIDALVMVRIAERRDEGCLPPSPGSRTSRTGQARFRSVRQSLTRSHMDPSTCWCQGMESHHRQSEEYPIYSRSQPSTGVPWRNISAGRGYVGTVADDTLRHPGIADAPRHSESPGVRPGLGCEISQC
jgi:hypothetical protein